MQVWGQMLPSGTGIRLRIWLSWCQVRQSIAPLEKEETALKRTLSCSLWGSVATHFLSVLGPSPIPFLSAGVAVPMGHTRSPVDMCSRGTHKIKGNKQQFLELVLVNIVSYLTTSFAAVGGKTQRPGKGEKHGVFVNASVILVISLAT